MEGEVIIVGVDASNKDQITDYALEWAVQNVIKPMDALILLALVPSPRRPPTPNNQTLLSSLLKKWGLGHDKENSSTKTGFFIKPARVDQQERINSTCLHMIQQLCSAQNLLRVHIEVNVMADAKLGSVAEKARALEATWVILDSRLKKESDCCLKQLSCNVVVMEHAIPRILRAVNPMTTTVMMKKLHMNGDLQENHPTMADMLGLSMPPLTACENSSSSTRSSSSLSAGSRSSFSLSSTSAEKEQFHKSSNFSTKSKSNKFFLKENEVDQEREGPFSLSQSPSPLAKVVSSFDTNDHHSDSSAGKFPPNSSEAIPEGHTGVFKMRNDRKRVYNTVKSAKTQPNFIPSRRSTNSRHLLRKPESQNQYSDSVLERTSSIRNAMPISIKRPPTPPPLCSICNHKAPFFGKRPRKFSYEEIKRATEGFSGENFLEEGGYGAVYKGVLADGQVVAVKKHKVLSAQVGSEFVSEVEILSCAQHRNLVMLVGYCTEIEWILVYEFVCNGSLDKHLYGRKKSKEVMGWEKRMKVAKGAASGLRYLHEDCRVGCIVHRDFRPENILLTHHFEPMVGDFGLARWQVNRELAEETRVIGTFGYLAPEYTQTGLITEKADVYAFGVVLLELLSGVKCTDFSRNTGKQFVLDWGGPLLEKKMVNEIIDGRLEQNYVEKEVEWMMYAANLCISTNPQQRPKMSKVLQILEGDVVAPTISRLPNYGQNPQKLVHDQRHTMNQPNIIPTKPLRPAYQENYEVVSSGEEEVMNHNTDHQLVNDYEEYQAYLHESMAKFIQNMN